MSKSSWGKTTRGRAKNSKIASCRANFSSSCCCAGTRPSYPTGETVVGAGDLLVTAAPEFENRQEFGMYEEYLGAGHEWAGKTVREPRASARLAHRHDQEVGQYRHSLRRHPSAGGGHPRLPAPARRGRRIIRHFSDILSAKRRYVCLKFCNFC